MKKIKINNSISRNIKNIFNGAYYPLKGFLQKEDFLSVLDNMRLKNGSLWSIPIVLDIDENKKRELKNEKSVLLENQESKESAILQDIEIYQFDKREYAKKIFGTLDKNHPGVNKVFKMKKYLIGGYLIEKNKLNKIFPKYNYTPKETKDIFKRKKWKTIAAFQTRNIPHRSHEYLQRKALKLVDGIFIQPVMGDKKKNDFKDDIIIGAYKILIKNYYLKSKVFFGIIEMDMHYAGPREAVMHALIRRNYGCTHIIIGRDHAGVGDYYNENAAHRIFDNFTEKELGIKILKYQNVSYCNSCKKFVEKNSCCHPEAEKIFLSGTKIRRMINNKERLPEELVRKEISDFLLKKNNLFI